MLNSYNFIPLIHKLLHFKKLKRVFILAIMVIILVGCKKNNEIDSSKVIEIEEIDFSKISKELKEDYDNLEILNIDEIRGNIHLPQKGINDSQITWQSLDPEIISDKEVSNLNYDPTPAGVVTRQEEDNVVTLVATLSRNEEKVQKEFKVTVKKKIEPLILTNYMFAYFTGDRIGQEAIFFGASKDGFSWKELNFGRAAIKSELGTKGLRDPFIIRSPEGDKFYMIATDLQIAADGDWWKAQTNGSKSIMVWESNDLINWSEQRMIEINSKTAGCTWAPEAFYDEITGEYIVFWASRVLSDNYGKQRMYYSKTRDFYNFTKPKVWVDYEFSTIDSTVIKDGDTYFRFTKYEDKSTILLEHSKSLLGEWTNIESPSLDAQKGVEGPTSFLLNKDDQYEGNRFGLLLDNFGGVGYYLMVSKDLSSGEFEKRRGYNLPKGKPRHGTVIAISDDEYNNLMEKYEQ